MDAVKEAQLEQKLDDLSLQFERAEQRNREEHREIRAGVATVRTDLGAEIKGLRAEMNEGFRDLHRLLFLGMASFIASIVASVAAVIVAHSL